jgi:hypothetical protein
VKVKLLKDLPDVPTGAIFENKGKDTDFFYKYQRFGREVNFSFNRDTVIANRDWFEEVKDQDQPQETKKDNG